jgi:DNA-binding beta-propeller fold protein YncE
VAGNTDGIGDAARFEAPVGITVDSAGIVYVVDQFESNVRRITPDGAVTTLPSVLAADSASTSETLPTQSLNHPNGIAADCFGNLYIADTGNNSIRKMAADGSVRVLAGAGAMGAADGQGADARFNGPFGIAVDLDGNVCVTDQGNSTVRKITPDGRVTTLGGVADAVGSADGIGAARSIIAWPMRITRPGEPGCSDCGDVSHVPSSENETSGAAFPDEGSSPKRFARNALA